MWVFFMSSRGGVIGPIAVGGGSAPLRAMQRPDSSEAEKRERRWLGHVYMLEFSAKRIANSGNGECLQQIAACIKLEEGVRRSVTATNPECVIRGIHCKRERVVC